MWIYIYSRYCQSEPMMWFDSINHTWLGVAFTEKGRSFPFFIFSRRHDPDKLSACLVMWERKLIFSFSYFLFSSLISSFLFPSPLPFSFHSFHVIYFSLYPDHELMTDVISISPIVDKWHIVTKIALFWRPCLLRIRHTAINLLPLDVGDFSPLRNAYLEV